jgi:hypothetical protein
MSKFVISFLLAILFTCSFAQEGKNPKEYDPWFTGPLLCPSANNLDPGSFNIQPYLFFTETYPDSGAHQFTVEESNYVQYGLLKYLDVTFFFHLLFNEKEHENSFGYGDTTVSFGLQALKQVPHTLTPSIRITIAQTFPTGKFRNLDPTKGSVDSFGAGAFRTKVALQISKTVYWIRYHPIAFRLYFPFSVPSLVLVKGFNASGGGYNTYGKVRPPYVFSSVFAYELSLTQRWVFATDFWYEYDSKSTFSGNPGTNIDGTIASNGSLAGHTLSIAPAIEYNVNSDFGFIAGVWFTALTKNTSDFVSYAISFTYTF